MLHGGIFKIHISRLRNIVYLLISYSEKKIEASENTPAIYKGHSAEILFKK